MPRQLLRQALSEAWPGLKSMHGLIIASMHGLWERGYYQLSMAPAELCPTRRSRLDSTMHQCRVPQKRARR
eukprot:38295-Rhodomonas_salina.2